jgi:hypothetical protein
MALRTARSKLDSSSAIHGLGIVRSEALLVTRSICFDGNDSRQSIECVSEAALSEKSQFVYHQPWMGSR